MFEGAIRRNDECPLLSQLPGRGLHRFWSASRAWFAKSVYRVKSKASSAIPPHGLRHSEIAFGDMCDYSVFLAREGLASAAEARRRSGRFCTILQTLIEWPH